MEVGDHVGVGERAQRVGAHRLMEPVLGREQPGGVGDDELRVVAREDPHDRHAGGLRLGRDDGEMLADEGIEQGGLADVGPAGEDDGAALGHRRKVHAEMEAGSGERGAVPDGAARGPARTGRYRSPLPERRSPPRKTERAWNEKLAAAYSPTTSQSQYHRR